ncbi:hypothetical protein [Staphylococcus equorum]|uniref:Uncharacterized protein n=1 Tax=Staphylococcus equorum TaxID=246432 RepID=A0A9X4LGK9_9STAP|nr:hypothetical protein [Staphylococcus equorum]MDG0860395.1 hypothetical protein [Staphylococcus equorum]
MENHQYITGDKAIIVSHIANHPYELNTNVTILGKEDHGKWKVSDGYKESIVTGIDLFPSYDN